MSTTTHSPSPSAFPQEAGAAGASFSEQHVLHQLAHYLPSQTPLKDFIHHNSLHAFQDLKFYEAIFTASKIFGFQVTLQLEEYQKLYANG
ncbi:MAG TPA: putative inorganic carbon transporter subunit DabA, partial [Flavisolibacter sp.]